MIVHEEQVLSPLIYYANGNINTMECITSPSGEATLLKINLFPACFISDKGQPIRELREPLPCAAFNDVAKALVNQVKEGDNISICGRYIEGSYLAGHCDVREKTRHILIMNFIKC